MSGAARVTARVTDMVTARFRVRVDGRSAPVYRVPIILFAYTLRLGILDLYLYLLLTPIVTAMDHEPS